MGTMRKKIKNENLDYPATCKELLHALQDQTGKYQHLKFILYNDDKNLSLGMKQSFLLVSEKGFGVFNVVSVKYVKGMIKMKLKETITEKIVHLTLNINDKQPIYFLICWNDIKQLVYQDKNSFLNDIDLLELES